MEYVTKEEFYKEFQSIKKAFYELTKRIDNMSHNGLKNAGDEITDTQFGVIEVSEGLHEAAEEITEIQLALIELSERG